MFDDDPKSRYAVVINHEEQYSIWPVDREVPRVWKAVGFTGNKQGCLDYIEEVWTDMRPLSLRKEDGETGTAPRGRAETRGVAAGSRVHHGCRAPVQPRTAS